MLLVTRMINCLLLVELMKSSELPSSYHVTQLTSESQPYHGCNYLHRHHHQVKRIKRSPEESYSVSDKDRNRIDQQDSVDDEEKQSESTNWLGHQSIEADIKHLRYNLVRNFASVRNSFANDTVKQSVRKTIIDKFVKLRLETWTHKFNATEMRFLNLPVIEGMNIIAILPGSSRGTEQESILLIGAHYDTVLLSSGVNDNGSGMVAMLEVARLLTANRCHLKSTVIFVAFDLEEYGGLGSRHLVHEYLIPIHLAGKRSKFKGAFILDTLLNFDETPSSQDIPADIQRVLPFWGRNDSFDSLRGDFMASYTRKSIDSILGSTLEKHWLERNDGSRNFKMINVDIPSLPSDMPNVKVLSDHVNFLRSDHVMFWYHNSSLHKPTLKAVFLTDTGPFRGYMRKCYHETCDNLSIVTETNLKFLKLFVEVLTSTILDLGDGLCKAPRGLAKKDVRQSSGAQAYPLSLLSLLTIIITIGVSN